MPSTLKVTKINGDGLLNESAGQVLAVLQAMEKAGFTRETLARIRREPNFISRLREAAETGAIYETLSQHRARVHYCPEDENFFGPRDWWRLVGIPLSAEHLRLIEYFPWPAELIDTLDPFDPTKHLWETHFAFPLWTTIGPDYRFDEEIINIRWWYSRMRHCFGYNQDQIPWFYNQGFALEPSFFPRWYLVRLVPPEVTLNLTFKAQKENIPEGYEMVPPVVMVTAHLLYFLAHDHHFYPDVQEPYRFGRCGDPTGVLGVEDGIVVGATSEGLHLQQPNPAQLPSLGLHLMRKQPKELERRDEHKPKG